MLPWFLVVRPQYCAGVTVRLFWLAFYLQPKLDPQFSSLTLEIEMLRLR